MSENDVLEADVAQEQELEDTQEGKFLTFSLKNEEFGIEIRDVREIIGIQKITEVPEMPAYIKGVINLRGKIIPVMDIRIRFNIEEKEYDERTTIIVINIHNTDIGVIVDNVSEVMDIAAKDIEPPSRIGDDGDNQFVKAFGKVGDNVVIIAVT